jgi:hypothetical protein
MDPRRQENKLFIARLTNLLLLILVHLNRYLSAGWRCLFLFHYRKFLLLRFDKHFFMRNLD